MERIRTEVYVDRLTKVHRYSAFNNLNKCVQKNVKMLFWIEAGLNDYEIHLRAFSLHLYCGNAAVNKDLSCLTFYRYYNSTIIRQTEFTRSA